MNPQNSPNPPETARGFPQERGTEISADLAETKTHLAQTAREAATKVKSAASDTAARARDEVSRFAAEKKETTAERIGGYSSAMHDTARSLEEKDPNIAWFTHRAADKLQTVSDYVRNQDFTALRHDAENVARRHPAAFFGGMFLAGLILGNVVKASRRKLDESDDHAGDAENDASGQREMRIGQQRSEPDLTDAERAAAGI